MLSCFRLDFEQSIYELDNIAVYFLHSENNQLADTDNIKRNDLIDADNGNKRTLPNDQVDQTEFCFL
jgi:hypothetical protein